MRHSLTRRAIAALQRPVGEGDPTTDIPPPRPPHSVGLALWLFALAAVTIAMLDVRAHLKEAHVALLYLLVVLGSSAYAGRAFGLVVSVSSFVLFDWLFLPPYGTLNVNNSLDWIILFSFFGTSVIAAQLLDHARDQARSAQARAVEIDRLAVLGAETLNAGRAVDALPAIADVIRSTLGLEWCEVYQLDPETGVVSRGAASPAMLQGQDGAASAEGKLVQWVAVYGGEAVELDDGTSRVSSIGSEVNPPIAATSTEASAPVDRADDTAMRALYLPLHVRNRVVGVLGIGASVAFRLGSARRRVLRALSYYAALAVERVRLVRDAESAAALREADRLKDAVLGSVSHDLRTPLTTIKALANEMSVGGDERAALIEQEADRLNRFVENLLDLSRIRAGGAGRPPAPNDAEDLLGAALRRISGRSANRDIRVSVNSDDESLIGLFDFTDTLHALVNILENAIKYSPAHMPVDVTVTREGSWLTFWVADRGRGIPVSEQERIFEPFYRPATAPLDAGGAGLGLSIARRLAAAQGGTVTLTPRDGGGSVFALRLPASDVVAPSHTDSPL
jgi:two-component system sensor histidine kinase KdpD